MDLATVLRDAIEEGDFWWFRELYSVLISFADEPGNTISRIGGVSVAEDLGHFRDCILAKYPDAAELAVMKVAGDADAILGRRSIGGEGYEEAFWTNQGFQEHVDWRRIRAQSRAFLLC